MKERECPMCKYPHNTSQYCHECNYNFEQYSNNDASDGIFEHKCNNCSGTGYVQIATNARGIKKCNFCNGTGKRK